MTGGVTTNTNDAAGPVEYSRRHADQECPPVKRRQLKRAKQRRRRRSPGFALDDVAHLPREHQAAVVLRGFTSRTLAGAPDAPALADLVDQAINLAAAAARVHRAEQPPRQAIACAPGCSHCCLVNVRATPPEVLRIADHIRADFSPAAITALRGRLATSIAAAGADDDARLGATVYCPLLDNDRCSVYDHRPMKCRGVESFDAETCRKGFVEAEDVPHRFDLMHYTYFNMLQIALIDGLGDAGMPTAVLDLSRALQIALDDPDAGARWLAGEPVFDEARRAPAPGSAAAQAAAES